jgi:hypothetical protein
MSHELLYGIDQWIILIVLMIIDVLAIAVGFHLGNKQQLPYRAKGGFLLALQISLLSFLALLLSFAFAMATFRHEVRKNFLVEESNAIYSVNLMAQMLPEPSRQEVLDLLSRYLKLRSEDVSSEYDQKKLERLERAAESLQLQIWRKVSELAKHDPQSNTAALLLNSIDHMIDFYIKREISMANHVPEVILFLLFFASALTLLLLGYGLGLEKSHNFFPIAILTLLILLVTDVIIDLDRPRDGFIRVSLNDLPLPNRGEIIRPR